MKNLIRGIVAFLVLWGLGGHALGDDDFNTMGTASAFGVITRSAGAMGRFLVMDIEGVFRPGSELSIFDPQGRFVGKGVAISIYPDGFYMDVENAEAVAIQAGFIVGMNLTEENARTTAGRYRGVLASIRQDVKKEEAERLKETKRVTEEEKMRRETHRDQVYMKQLEIEKYRNYYHYYGYYGRRYWYW